MTITPSKYPEDLNAFWNEFHKGVCNKSIYPIIAALIKNLCQKEKFQHVETLINKLIPGLALKAVMNSLPTNTKNPNINRLARINEIMTGKTNPKLPKSLAHTETRNTKLPKIAILITKEDSKVSDKLINPVFLENKDAVLPSLSSFNELVIPLQVHNLKLKHDPDDIITKFNGLKHQGNTLSAKVVNFVDEKIHERIFAPSMLIYSPDAYGILPKISKECKAIAQLIMGKKALVCRFPDDQQRDRFTRKHTEFDDCEKEMMALDRNFVCDIASTGSTVASIQSILTIEISDSNYSLDEIVILIQEFEEDKDMFKVIDTGNLSFIVTFKRKENGLDFFNQYQGEDLFEEIKII